MKSRMWVAMTLLILAFGCQSQPRKLTIAVAASLEPVMQAIVDQYEATGHPAISLTAGASGTLSNQILHAAPFDMFFSADLSYPEQLRKEGFVDEDSIYTFGWGHLILWSMRSQDTAFSLDLLNNPEIEKIALADPSTAPYGQLAKTALQKAQLWEPLQGKFVFGESIGQVNQWIATGNAEVGLTALSTVKSGAMMGKGHYWLLPDSLSPALGQGMVIIKAANTLRAEAKAFREFMQGPIAQGILRDAGY